MLYTLVTGKNPPIANQRKSNEQLPDLAGIHPEITQAIEKAMAFEHYDRSKSVAEWLEMLPDLPLPALTPVQPPSNPEQSKPLTLEVKAGLAIAALTMVFGGFQGVMAIVSFVYSKESPAPIQNPLKPSSSLPK